MNKLWVVWVGLLFAPAFAAAQDPETAETSTTATSTTEAPSAEATAAAPEGEAEDADPNVYPQLYPNKKYIDSVLERSKHASLGYALGRQGDGFVFGVRFDKPVTKTNWAYLQGFYYTNFGPLKGWFDPVLMLGVNFVVRTKLVFGIFRLYGGGGFHAGFRPSPQCRNPLGQGDIALSYVEEGKAPQTRAPSVQQVQQDPSLGPVAKRIQDLEDDCKDQKDPFSISGGGTGGIEFFSSAVRAYFIEISGGGGTQKNGIWSDSGLILRAGNQFYF